MLARSVWFAHTPASRSRGLCDALERILRRHRAPPCPPCAAAAFAAFSALHALHPPSEAVTLPLPSGAPALVLLTNRYAWSPVDASQRRKESSAALASEEPQRKASARGGAATRSGAGAGADWEWLSRLVQSCAESATAKSLSAARAGAVFGESLALSHASAVLSDDASARLAVFPGARAALGSRDARSVLRGAQLYRLFDLAACKIHRSKLLESLVALISAGEAQEDDADELVEEQEEAEEMALDEAPAQAAPDSPVGSAECTPQKPRAGDVAGIGGLTPPSALRRGPAGCADCDEDEPAGAAASLFPQPSDVSCAASRILLSLLAVLQALEADGEWGAPGARAGWRHEADVIVTEAWLQSRADGRGLLQASPDATLRIARLALTMGAKDGSALRTAQATASACDDAIALFQHVEGSCADAMRPLRRGGGCGAQRRSVARASLLLAGVARRAVEGGATKEDRLALAGALARAGGAVLAAAEIGRVHV